MRRAAHSVPTVETLRKVRRKQSRRSIGAVLVLNRMQAGASLFCSFEKGLQLFKLSTGATVKPDVAKEVICNPHVVGQRDGLFADATPQTWRYENDG